MLTVMSASFNAKASIEIAPLLGYRLNNMNDSTGGLGFSQTPGYQVGGLVLFSLLDTIALRSGLIYVLRDTSMTNNKYHISYMDIPLDVQLRLRPSGFYIFGGMKLGIKNSDSCDSACGLASN